MLFNKKRNTEEEKETNRLAELEDAFIEEEKEHYYLLKEAYRKITEDSNGVKSRRRRKLEKHLFRIVKDLKERIETSCEHKL